MWSLTSFESALQTIQNRSILPVLDKYLYANDRILEAGCGNGAWVFYLRDKGYRAVGIDNNRRILEQGISRTIQLVENDVLEKCFRDDTFDACLSLGVIEHFPEGPHLPLQELKRVLRPGGFLFVSTPCNNWLRKLLNHPLRDLANMFFRIQGSELYFVEFRFERDELVEHVRSQGLRILESVPNDFRLDQHQHSFGFYTDWPMFRDKREKWRHNGLGGLLFRVLKWISPHLVVSGVLVVAQKPPSAQT